jgi:hypothetical protein
MYQDTVVRIRAMNPRSTNVDKGSSSSDTFGYIRRRILGQIQHLYVYQAPPFTIDSDGSLSCTPTIVPSAVECHCTAPEMFALFSLLLGVTRGQI